MASSVQVIPAEEGGTKPSKSPSSAPAVVQEAVLVKSSPMPADFSTQVKGYKFERGVPIDYHGLLQSFRTSGFQATNFGLAVEQVTKMVSTM